MGMERWLLLAFIFLSIAQQPLPPLAVFNLPSQNSPSYVGHPSLIDAGAGAVAPNPLSVDLPTATVLNTLLAGGGPINICPVGNGQQCIAGSACDATFLVVPIGFLPFFSGQNLIGGTYTITFGPWALGNAAAWTHDRTDATGPRQLCIVGGPAGVLPFNDVNGRPYAVQAKWDCSPANIGAALAGTVACASANRIAYATTIAAVGPLTGQRLASFLAESQCCLNPNTATAPFINSPIGVCVNPNIQSCCGQQPLTAPDQCCSAITPALPTVLGVNQACPCGGPSSAALPAGAPPGFTALACPGTQTCCRKTKYSFTATSFGRCYNAQTHLCCDTGDIFDPTVQQCCPINGLQSSNVPCPCGQNADCQGSTFPTADGTPADVRKSMQCCFQTAPPVNEKLSCSVFDNFNPNGALLPNLAPVPPVIGPPNPTFNVNPNGIAPHQTQRCRGFCIDVNYQICCNGVACIREFERCCNNTCCNTFVGTCAPGYRAGSIGNRWNSREYNIVYEQCSTIEVTTSINVFWIYILPTALLLSTLLGFAIALAFANIAARGRLSLLEKMMIFFATFALLCSCLLFFAPVYKYGILVVIVALLAIITAAARVRWLNVLFIIAVILLLWYVIDPLDGNDFWGVGYRRLNSGKPDPLASGMWHTTGSIWHNVSQVNDATNWCVNFYNYFRYDPALRDGQRLHNPVVTTFGYCSRGWVFALLIMEGFITICLFLLLLLGLLALLLRFRKMAFDPIELEIVNT